MVLGFKIVYAGSFFECQN